MKFLDYEKSSILGCNTGNSRNGFYERDLDTSYGRLYIKVPRDRNGHFEQQLILDYARRTNELETTLITFYKKGITTREISGGNPKKHLHYKFTQKT
ncbi:MAG: transposase [Roseburia sp.]|nr:transposase [Roseburia sp.]